VGRCFSGTVRFQWDWGRFSGGVSPGSFTLSGFVQIHLVQALPAAV